MITYTKKKHPTSIGCIGETKDEMFDCMAAVMFKRNGIKAENGEIYHSNVNKYLNIFC